MHHWTVHEKVDFLKFPRDTEGGGGYSTTFDPELRIEVKKFSMLDRGVYSTTCLLEVRNEIFTLIFYIDILHALKNF